MTWKTEPRAIVESATGATLRTPLPLILGAAQVVDASNTTAASIVPFFNELILQWIPMSLESSGTGVE